MYECRDWQLFFDWVSKVLFYHSLAATFFNWKLSGLTVTPLDIMSFFSGSLQDFLFAFAFNQFYSGVPSDLVILILFGDCSISWNCYVSEVLEYSQLLVIQMYFLSHSITPFWDSITDVSELFKVCHILLMLFFCIFNLFCSLWFSPHLLYSSIFQFIYQLFQLFFFFVSSVLGSLSIEFLDSTFTVVSFQNFCLMLFNKYTTVLWWNSHFVVCF